VHDLTPGRPEAEFGGWAWDRGSFFILTNERDQRFFDVYECDVEGYSRTMLFTNTQGLTLWMSPRIAARSCFQRPTPTLIRISTCIQLDEDAHASHAHSGELLMFHKASRPTARASTT